FAVSRRAWGVCTIRAAVTSMSPTFGERNRQLPAMPRGASFVPRAGSRPSSGSTWPGGS
ncbi:cytochrome P450, partial [Streptococcus pyogenes]